MCDYSLHLITSRPAKVGDKLISTRFPQTSTRGFASVDDRNVAVCLLPGTELAFEREVQRDTGMVFGWKLDTASPSFNMSTRANQTFTMMPLSFPTARPSCSHICARVSAPLCCNCQRACLSRWTTNKGTIRLSNRRLLRSNTISLEERSHYACVPAVSSPGPWEQRHANLSIAAENRHHPLDTSERSLGRRIICMRTSRARQSQAR